MCPPCALNEPLCSLRFTPLLQTCICALPILPILTLHALCQFLCPYNQTIDIKISVVKSDKAVVPSTDKLAEAYAELIQFLEAILQR